MELHSRYVDRSVDRNPRVNAYIVMVGVLAGALGNESNAVEFPLRA